MGFKQERGLGDDVVRVHQGSVGRDPQPGSNQGGVVCPIPSPCMGVGYMHVDNGDG